MLEVRFFGKLRRFADDPSPDTDSIRKIREKENESLQDLIKRIGIKNDDLGELFINGKVASLDDPVPPDARVGIFPRGMHLLCGGQHLKGHGNISKSPDHSPDYW